MYFSFFIVGRGGMVSFRPVSGIIIIEGVMMMDVQKQVNRVHLLKTLRLAHRWLYESRENWDIEEVEKEKLFKAVSEVVEVMQMVNEDVEKNRQVMSDEEKREAKKLYDKWYKDYI